MDARVREAGGLVLAVVGVKGRIICDGEEAEWVLAWCVLVRDKTLVRICKELADMKCAPHLGCCAFTDLNVLILIAVSGRAPAWLLGI